MKKGMIIFICYALLILGISPEIYALTVSSSHHYSKELEKNSAVISSRLTTMNIQISPEEVSRLLGKREIQAYAAWNSPFKSGGYYPGTSSNQNQYSAFFGNVENFLIELVEFFLFLAMLSYIVGYEDWLPWEKEKDPS